MSKLEILSLNMVPFGNRITAMKAEQKLPKLVTLILGTLMLDVENSLIGLEGLKHISSWEMPEL